MKIKYPLSEEQKSALRERLDKVLEQEEGEQVIILWDKEKLTDYYQNTCLKRLLEEIEKSAKDFGEVTHNQLINIHE